MNKTIGKLAGVLQISTASDLADRGTLGKGRVAVLRGVKGRRIVCTAGQLWITRDGDPMDHVLSVGQSLELGGRGRVVLGGAGTASYRLA